MWVRDAEQNQPDFTAITQSLTAPWPCQWDRKYIYLDQRRFFASGFCQTTRTFPSQPARCQQTSELSRVRGGSWWFYRGQGQGHSGPKTLGALYGVQFTRYGINGTRKGETTEIGRCSQWKWSANVAVAAPAAIFHLAVIEQAAHHDLQLRCFKKDVMLAQTRSPPLEVYFSGIFT